MKNVYWRKPDSIDSSRSTSFLFRALNVVIKNLWYFFFKRKEAFSFEIVLTNESLQQTGRKEDVNWIVASVVPLHLLLFLLEISFITFFFITMGVIVFCFTGKIFLPFQLKKEASFRLTQLNSIVILLLPKVKQYCTCCSILIDFPAITAWWWCCCCSIAIQWEWIEPFQVAFPKVISGTITIMITITTGSSTKFLSL